MKQNVIDPFIRDENNLIIGLTAPAILMPSQENPYKMRFGGEVLKSFDELSGLLAGHFFGGHALHVAELVLFKKPVFTGHTYISTFQVIVSKPGFVTMLGTVRSQEIGSPELSQDIRYAGLAICAKVDNTSGKIIKENNPSPIFPENWVDTEIVEKAQTFFNFQKELSKLL